MIIRILNPDWEIKTQKKYENNKNIDTKINNILMGFFEQIQSLLAPRKVECSETGMETELPFDPMYEFES